MRTRSQILAENVQKFGHPDMIVTNNYPRDYKKSKLQFDVILTDVPCSGEGMFRKDEGAIGEWSTQNVNNCWQLQRNRIGYLELSEARRYPDLLYLHLQCARR